MGILQTKKWESGYFETRRNIKARKRRLLYFGIHKKNSILDLGCGDGLNTAILYKSGYKRIVGLDFSKRFIREARKNNPTIDFYLGDVNALPFGAKKFDIVLVDSVFHHLLDYGRPIKEIYRVLIPRGFLCLVEPHHSLVRGIVDFICSLSISRWLPFIQKRRTSYLDEKPLMTYWLKTEDSFYDSLVKQGFRKVFHKKNILSIVAKYQKI